MPEKKIGFQLKNDLAALHKVREAIAEFGQCHHLPAKVLCGMNLALEEILTNVISYGYDDNEAHQITVRLFLERDEFTAEVEDDGRPFNPLEAPTPNTEQPLEERPVGGLGIHLVRNLMDALQYRRQAGRNILMMKKKTRES